MQQRIIDPPKDQWDQLPTPLTPGENKVYNLFDAGLPLEWEVYIQPHLNGLRPNLVLLNPFAGVAVFEIIDWDLNALEDSIKHNQTTKNPINQIRLYEDEIFNLYCPRLDDRYGKSVITAGLIFTQICQAKVNRLLNPLRFDNMETYPDQYPFSGLDTAGNIDALFPEYKKWGRANRSRVMSEDTANDLRGWLKEPAFSKEQREPLELNSRQLTIATDPTQERYRKVRGPAGSGKSQALAARAAILASEGKRVFVCTFNITLMNYLRDIVAQHAHELAAQQGGNPRVIRQQVEFRHFHGWCKYICYLAGCENDYFRLWSQFSETAVLDEHLAKLVSQIYKDSSVHDALPIYDAILVDEGQDYNKDWWQTLRAAVEPEPDGEMLLVADKTQNIFGTDVTWLEGPLRGTGISSSWYNLEMSYRLPSEIVPILEDFAENFLVPSGVEVDIPKQMEIDFNPPIKFRWVQVSSENSIAEICFEEARRQMQRLQSDTAIPDIIFLTPRNDTGLMFVEKCEEKNIHVLNTFREENQDPDAFDQGSNFDQYENSRRKKLAFFMGNARIKATTLHSFKGWESRHLVLYVSRIASAEDRALFYTALTRLKKHPNGSMLTVVSDCPELYNFGERNFSPNFFSR